MGQVQATYGIAPVVPTLLGSIHPVATGSAAGGGAAFGAGASFGNGVAIAGGGSTGVGGGGGINPMASGLNGVAGVAGAPAAGGGAVGVGGGAMGAAGGLGALAGAGGGGGGLPPVAPLSAQIFASLASDSSAKIKVDTLKADATPGALWRSAANIRVASLGADAVVQAEASIGPSAHGVVDDVKRLVALYGDSAWAMIFSNRKVEGSLPAEGRIASSVLLASEGLERFLRARIAGIVGEVRERAATTDITQLARDVLTLDLNYDLAVRILGGIAPREVRGRQQSVSRGHWGAFEGARAAGDVERAMRHLGDLIGQAHGLAGGCDMSGEEYFGLDEMARVAFAVLAAGDVKQMFVDTFARLSRQARERRAGNRLGAVDVQREVDDSIEKDLNGLEQDAITRATAVAAMAAGRGGVVPALGATAAVDGGGQATKTEKRKQKREAAAAAKVANKKQLLSLAATAGGNDDLAAIDGGAPSGALVPSSAAMAASAAGRLSQLEAARAGNLPAGDVQKMIDALKSITDNSVTAFTGPKSAAACFDYAQKAIGRKQEQMCCPFAMLVPPCKKPEACNRCKNSAPKPPSALLQAVLGKMSPSLRESIIAKRKAGGLI